MGVACGDCVAEVNLASPCQQDPIHFSAVSVVRCDGATYEWAFGGGTVLAIEGPEAWVAFDQEGTYDVGLTVTDTDGATDTWTWENLIEVVNAPVVARR